VRLKNIFNEYVWLYQLKITISLRKKVFVFAIEPCSRKYDKAKLESNGTMHLSYFSKGQ